MRVVVPIDLTVPWSLTRGRGTCPGLMLIERTPRSEPEATCNLGALRSVSSERLADERVHDRLAEGC
jgi:hypothetical protein